MSIEERMERIEKLLIIGSKNVLNVADVSLLLGLSESRIRTLCSSKEIPHYKQGVKVFFKKSEIEEWQLEKRVPTNDEIRQQAITRTRKIGFKNK